MLNLVLCLVLLQSIEIKQTVFNYDEAMVLSKYNKQKVVVFVNCDVVDFVDKKKVLIVRLQENPKHSAWQNYKDGVLVGEWQGNQFVVLKFVHKSEVNEQLLLTNQEVQQIPSSYQGCTSCQQLLLNKLRR